jgi:hypothetical protein
VRMAVIHLELDLVQQRARAIDFDDARRPALGNHDASTGQWLKRVNLDPLSLVSVGRCRVVRPNDFSFGDFDLHNLARALLDHEGSASQRVNVMDPFPRHLPFDVAIARDNRQLPVTLQHEPMLCPGRLGERQEGKNCDGNWKSASHDGDLTGGS